MPAGQADNRARKRIGRYLVTGRIGRGGMGMVYRGLDEALEREVAIKTLTIEGTLDEESRKRFEIEAKAAAKLQHPNILTVFELGEDRGVPFIAMELLPGADLETLLRSGDALLLEEKLEVAIQICRGLAYAHEHRIVHRDIKPSNIRILDDGTAKIMDFGIAKLQGTGVTKSGMMVGTVHYMSPEQVRGQPLDGRSDVFSVGVILYELLAGRRPFSGQSATEVLYKIVHESPPPLPSDPGPADPRLEEILDRALAKDVEARYAGAARMADDLSKLLGELTRAGGGSVAPADLETVNLARRLLKEGRVEESLRRLREVDGRNPRCLEARRALRAATREMQRRQRPPEPEAEQFPELEATFQASPTRREPETVVQPTVVKPPPVAPAPAAPTGRGLLIGAGAAVAAALAIGLLLLRGSSGVPPRPTALRVPVRSQPAGASVLVDGRDTGTVTDGELTLPPERTQVLLTFRKPGHREESRTVNLPLPPGEAVSVVLAQAASSVSVVSDPPGAAVSLDGQRLSGVTPTEVPVDATTGHRLTISLDGHKPQEVQLPAGRPPAAVRVALEPAGPLGTVIVASYFPVDVLWKGKVLAKGQASPRVSLPAGRQVLTLVSSAYFLRTSLTVDVRGGSQSSAEAPGLGKISIRANPDNCQVFIDGAFVDYPPILDRAIAAGAHTVSFKWPDGARSEEVTDVPRGGLKYVMGRKD